MYFVGDVIIRSYNTEIQRLHRVLQYINLPMYVPHIAPHPAGILAPSNTHFCFLVPTGVHSPNETSVGSAVFAGFTNVSNRHTDYRRTDRQTMLCISGMLSPRCGLGLEAKNPASASAS